MRDPARYKRSRMKYPDRHRARQKVKAAVRAGTLVRPDTCERCGVECYPDASHDDYDRPLDVEWLCRPCHVEKDLRTHCRNGHEFTPENTRRTPDGTRCCVTCKRERRRQQLESKRDSDSPGPANAQKTHCNNGHPYTPENTREWRGERYCRVCHRERMRARRAAAKSLEEGGKP